MRLALAALVVHLSVGLAVARPPPSPTLPPPRQEEEEEEEDDDEAVRNKVEDLMEGLGYNRYLKEVISVLEDDPDFRKKLESAQEDKIRDGSIANELDFGHRNLRSKLDEIKARELDRLRKLAREQHRQGKQVQRASHINVAGDRLFQAEDLKKLIVAANKDIDEIDRAQRKEFKRYEMEKRFEKEERLKRIKDEEARKAEEERLKQVEERHKDHQRLRHPMSKDQLENVWEEGDHMRPEDFDPNTFFRMHDLNSDGFLNAEELKALFVREIGRAYDPKNPDDDMRERDQEFENMQQHVFAEMDRDKDRLISLDEFLSETNQPGFGEDPGWDTIDERGAPFEEEEYRKFAEAREREIRDSVGRGAVPLGYPYYADEAHLMDPNYPRTARVAQQDAPSSFPGHQPNMQPNLQPPPGPVPNIQQHGQALNQHSGSQRGLNPAGGPPHRP